MGKSTINPPTVGEYKITRKNQVTWFLVANETRAQIYARRGSKPKAPKARHHEIQEKFEQELVPVTGMKWQAESPEDFEIRNTLLRSVLKNAAFRTEDMPYIDIRESLHLRFMQSISSQLKVAHQRKYFDRLVLIAPTKILEEIRKHLDKTLLVCVVAELPKESSHCKGQEASMNKTTKFQ